MAALALMPLGCVQPPAPEGEAVVGTPGSRVKVRIAGKGSPAVVLISGQGNEIDAWNEVQPSIGAMSLAVAYDRPGLGGSDPGAEPRTVSRMAAELHELLRTLRIPPPYVLCGHSLGGFVAQYFALLFPADVAGMVLVDPSIESFYARGDSMPEYRAIVARTAERLSRAPPGVRAEVAGFDSSRAEMRHVGRMPPVPIWMLISVHHGADAPAVEEAWRDMHVSWAGAQARGHYVIDSTSGHYLQRENPALVLKAVGDILAELGARTRPR